MSTTKVSIEAYRFGFVILGIAFAVVTSAALAITKNSILKAKESN